MHGEFYGIAHEFAIGVAVTLVINEENYRVICPMLFMAQTR
jgi:hypothetical protein